jgi:hypothetical protein
MNAAFGGEKITNESQNSSGSGHQIAAGRVLCPQAEHHESYIGNATRNTQRCKKIKAEYYDCKHKAGRE